MQERNLAEWIIARAPDCSYIGRPLPFPTDMGRSETDWLSHWQARDILRLSPAFELTSTVIPVRDNQGRIQHVRSVEVASVLALAHEVPIWVRPTTILQLSHMHADDRESYERMVLAAYQRLEAIQRERGRIVLSDRKLIT